MKEGKYYVFTNWGLCKARIVKARLDEKTKIVQYKVKIDIDKNNKNKDYGFWFVEDQLHKFYFTAIMFELFKPVWRKVESLFKA